ncbi:hypothetical protein [Sphingomonas psychrotolerans]|uniref:Uncharacterized protein n=1 Tax=Sphingomonas psychrotolerans TaxID=1327635 RepID=A0A2K8MHQ9_9SPHN|nr:hypothetical protein [Sphingomonas psychrotolerans]ATY33417.1 hypothetical protein CVN68_16780 [Sphingomonas psychrotolerans]
MIRVFRNSDVRSMVCGFVGVILFLAISDLAGFSAWLRAAPVAQAVVRVFAVLLFGAGGLVLLIWPKLDGPRARPLFYRLLGAFMLTIALAHATILFGDPLNIRPE